MNYALISRRRTKTTFGRSKTHKTSIIELEFSPEMSKQKTPECTVVQPDDTQKYVQDALNYLKEQGFRTTKTRRMVLQTLASTRKPLGPYEIRERVQKQGGKIDVVSVYRILAGLVEAGLAHHIGTVDGYLSCSSGKGGEHHTEHLICTICGCVEEMPLPNIAAAEISVSASRAGFDPKSTRVEVAGICSHCR